MTQLAPPVQLYALSAVSMNQAVFRVWQTPAEHIQVRQFLFAQVVSSLKPEHGTRPRLHNDRHEHDNLISLS